MIRFIIRRKWRDSISGAETDSFETLQSEAPELERILCGGGCGEGGFDIRELVGAEVERVPDSALAEEVDEPMLDRAMAAWTAHARMHPRATTDALLHTALTAALRADGEDKP